MNFLIKENCHEEGFFELLDLACTMGAEVIYTIEAREFLYWDLLYNGIELTMYYNKQKQVFAYLRDMNNKDVAANAVVKEFAERIRELSLR